jgi:hypothetical protein
MPHLPRFKFREKLQAEQLNAIVDVVERLDVPGHDIFASPSLLSMPPNWKQVIGNRRPWYLLTLHVEDGQHAEAMDLLARIISDRLAALNQVLIDDEMREMLLGNVSIGECKASLLTQYSAHRLIINIGGFGNAPDSEPLRSLDIMLSGKADSETSVFRSNPNIPHYLVEVRAPTEDAFASVIVWKTSFAFQTQPATRQEWLSSLFECCLPHLPAPSIANRFQESWQFVAWQLLGGPHLLIPIVLGLLVWVALSMSGIMLAGQLALAISLPISHILLTWWRLTTYPVFSTDVHSLKFISPGARLWREPIEPLFCPDKIESPPRGAFIDWLIRRNFAAYFKDTRPISFLDYIPALLAAIWWITLMVLLIWLSLANSSK